MTPHFHISNVEGAGFDALRQGQHVSYELGTDARRGNSIAIHVQSLP
jgi:cold shock CspA family protein